MIWGIIDKIITFQLQFVGLYDYGTNLEARLNKSLRQK
jgi:hypothetical protein